MSAAPSATDPLTVVTGLGATTPLGGDVETTWQAVLAGQPGVHALSNTWPEDYGIVTNFAATLKVPAHSVLTGPELRRADPSAQYALIAARQAWADAGAPDVAPERLAVVIASGIGGLHTMLTAWDTVRDRGARKLLPLTVPMLMPNSPAATVAIDLAARGGAHAPVSACASGAEALVLASRLIQQDLADVVVAGGTEAAIHPLTLGAFGRMRALSTRSDSPETASRPYCVTRDGFVMGEGAGALVVESAAHAHARGARVHARLAGVGSTSDAYDVAPPDPTGQGQIRAMRSALRQAGPAVARAVAHVNAHATATPAGDTIEARAIVEALTEALGSRQRAEAVKVSGTKSMTGHLLGAAGAVESIFAILALRDRLAPPTINIQELDPEVTCHVVRDQPEPLPATGPLAVMNNAFGFGGHNMALVFATA
ncbi:MAG: beta-ketoacyl-[acyl-carrier-protein] synthase family protein [Bifidobacteriaceae bacterium]|jgi:3-oxoacyl-[acyl-carrier-protein] synthase II|nr:beta-ketoacyl-[acyl-carrier-protein] synthase family protein [Bifidobacteriaceae bacterium]